MFFRQAAAGLRAPMTASRAEATFQRLGGDPQLRGDALKSEYRRLARRHHPDVGGRAADMVALNAAYEALSGARPTRARPAPEPPPRRPREARGVSSAEFEAWTDQAADLDFRRVQYRGYEPYPSMYWESQGYFGNVARTRTIKAADLTPSAIEASVIPAIKATLARIGLDDANPLDYIVKLTIEEPLGRNPGHAAVAWVTPQDPTARMFGHRTRWWSISITPPPVRKKKPPKGEPKLTGGRVESMFRRAGLVVMNPRATKTTLWRYADAESRLGTREIMTKDRVFGLEGYFGRHQLYYGQHGRASVEALITWVKGAGPWPFKEA